MKDHPEDQVLSKLHVVYQQLQANQKSQQDEIENRLKEIQNEVKAWTCTPETYVRYLNGFVKIAVREPKTVGHRLVSKKSASSTVQPSFFHLERSAVGNIL